MLSLLLAAAAFALVSGCESPNTKPAPTKTPATPPALSAEEAATIAKAAYIFGFPMAMGYKTRYAYAVDKENPDYKAPFNQVSCQARLFTPDDKAVVTPNADTPYCMFWMDLRAEPLVLTVPEIEAERFYHFQLIDLHTHNFAYVGTLTTGNGAGKYLLAGPDWKGEKPTGITDVIRSETSTAIVIERPEGEACREEHGVRTLQHVPTVPIRPVRPGSRA